MLRGLAGGVLIGLAAGLAWVLHGRIAGISGLLGRSLDRDGGAGFRRAFLAGLAGTGLVLALAFPSAIGPSVRGTTALVLAGVLVGLGTTLGNGCTSGHGVCGLARGSRRSLVAVCVFMATAALVVALAGPGAPR
ncbi:MAG: YeeE/YedE family protein [Deltaproteobacteria bacterium]|nr:YeeE/YedE family protein [Deltaproteobacteria bacterium]